MLEVKLVNFNVTPAAALALGLMFLRTSKAAAAANVTPLDAHCFDTVLILRVMTPVLLPVVWEGQLVNLDVTSQAATLVLGMMLVRTSKDAIAARIKLTNTD